MWNDLREKKDELRLEVFPLRLLSVLKFLSSLTITLSVLLLLNSILEVEKTVPVGLTGMILGFLIFSFGGTIVAITGLVRPFSLCFKFCKKEKKLLIENLPDGYSASFPQTIPFSEINTLRITRIQTKTKMRLYLLELIMPDDKYFPVTVFQDEHKARSIARTLQRALDCAVDEKTARSDFSLKTYKTDLMRQFQTDNPLIQN